MEQRDGLSVLYERRRKDGVKTAARAHKNGVKGRAYRVRRGRGVG